ncbi:MAG: chorismate synthase, partial [Bdellovibrionales bacterium]
LATRRPGLSNAVSARNEADKPEILSGVFEGKTLGTPIAVIVRNSDAKSVDYSEIKGSPRVGHADDVWIKKFGFSDHRGGGRSSGRETVSRVIAGSFAQMFIKQSNLVASKNSDSLVKYGVTVFPRQVGPLLQTDEMVIDGAKLGCANSRWQLSSERVQEISEFLESAKVEGQSYGGIAEVWIAGAPENLGQPVFHKLKADLAQAYMSIGATCGFEVGEGFSAKDIKGTEFHSQKTNAPAYGGIRGGISTGEKIILRVTFKPTSSILDVAKKGRHDPCIVLRALAVVEAMSHLVIADHILWARLDRV